MSISYQRFEEKLRELKELTGHPGQIAARALYDRLMYTDINDFDDAIESLAQADERINLANITKHINRHMVIRLEREACENKRREAAENTRFWKAHFIGSECVKHECWKCPRPYCNIVSNASIRAVKLMLSREQTAEEAHKNLAEIFPGLGFEDSMKENANIGPF